MYRTPAATSYSHAYASHTGQQSGPGAANDTVGGAGNFDVSHPQTDEAGVPLSAEVKRARSLQLQAQLDSLLSDLTAS